MKSERMRLDVALVARGLVESRELARRLILADQILLNDQPARKASQKVGLSDRLAVREKPRYVSRGGYKLEHALREFGLSVKGCVALDIGASTGGFTDCLLQHGAARVHAVDVGRGQLASKLRGDQRVVVHEGVNARYLRPADLGEAVDFVCVDASFISLTLLLPAAYQMLKPQGRLVALIKPQFEAGRAEVGRGGVVRKAGVRERVVAHIRRFAEESLGARVRGVVESPLAGPAGNREYLLCLEKP